MAKPLAGKVAIVTGGSGGIGSAICERLAQDGAAVAVHYAGDESSALEVVKCLAAQQVQAVAVQADLTQSSEVAALFEQTETQLGRPDILVNVAGARFSGALADASDDDFDKIFALNTKGVFYCLREAARRLKDGGRIVTISSCLVARPSPEMSLYVGSKAAVDKMAKVLSLELGARGITVNSVAPGPTETEQFDASVGDDKAKAAAAQSPFDRVGQPGDIADVVAFVVSENCRWITGHTFQASGGYV